MDLSDRLKFASRLARKAGALAMRAFKDPNLAGFRKQGGDVVTNVDFAIETLITEEIKKAYPTDAVFGEEFGGSSGTSPGLSIHWMALATFLPAYRFGAYRLPCSWSELRF
jgi:myo-inositol-1(or 4)-monophosphatase